MTIIELNSAKITPFCMDGWILAELPILSIGVPFFTFSSPLARKGAREAGIVLMAAAVIRPTAVIHLYPVIVYQDTVL